MTKKAGGRETLHVIINSVMLSLQCPTALFFYLFCVLFIRMTPALLSGAIFTVRALRINSPDPPDAPNNALLSQPPTSIWARDYSPHFPTLRHGPVGSSGSFYFPPPSVPHIPPTSF